jgi:hypothetical protein
VPALYEASQRHCDLNAAVALVRIGGEKAMLSLIDGKHWHFYWSHVAEGRKSGLFPEMPEADRKVVARLVEVANSDDSDRKWAKEQLAKLGHA